MASAPPPLSPFKPDCVKGKVVLITGGATGIGFGIGQTFGRHGASVAIMARRKAVIDEAVAKLESDGINAFGIVGDVREYESCVACVDSVVKHFGNLDYLINNAAGNFTTNAENLTSNGLKTVVGIDLQGCFHMAKAALNDLKKSGDACIVNITATLHYKATPFQMHAAAAKAGIDVLTQTMGVEWAEYGIRVVGIAPGPIADTVGGPGGRVFGQGGILDGGEPSPEVVRRTVPAGRYGRVEDIGLAALYICGPAGGFITATTVVVDGGQWHGASGDYQKAKKAIIQKSAKERSTHRGGVATSKL